MQICDKCYVSMISVMSFSKDKHVKYCQCPKCRGKTKPIPIKDSELVFGELLHNELNKQK